MPSPRIVDEEDMTPELDAAIRRSLCLCFPADQATFSRTRKWHGTGPAYSSLIELNNNVIAHVGVVERTLRFGEIPAKAAGIQNVFVLPDHRGQALADAVLLAAQDEAARRRFDCGVLFCVPELEKVYARCGWQTIHNQVVRVDETGSTQAIPSKNICMFLPIGLRVAPPGLLHLGGNDW